MKRLIVRPMSQVTLWVLRVFVFFPMVFWGGWLNLMSDTLRCEHSAARDVSCVTHSTGPGRGEHTVIARDAQGAELANLVSRSSGRRNTSSVLRIVTAAGEVHVPLTILSMMTPGGRQALAAQLDAFVKETGAPPLELTLRPAVPQRIMFGVIALLGLLGSFALARNTLLEVDAARRLVIKQRIWLIVRKSDEVLLDYVLGVKPGESQRRRTAMVLERQGGDPIHLGYFTAFSGPAVARIQAFIDQQKQSG